MTTTIKVSTEYSAAVRRRRAKVRGERMNGEVTNLWEASKEGQTPRRAEKPIWNERNCRRKGFSTVYMCRVHWHTHSETMDGAKRNALAWPPEHVLGIPETPRPVGFDLCVAFTVAPLRRRSSHHSPETHANNFSSCLSWHDMAPPVVQQKASWAKSISSRMIFWTRSRQRAFCLALEVYHGR